MLPSLTPAVRETSSKSQRRGVYYLFCDIVVDDIEKIARRIKSDIQSKIYRIDEKNILATVSIGVIEKNNENESFSEFFDEVDKTMYKAKADGRNKIYFIK
jgi:diguanylate cyclase (GGDEF)-like protein